MFGKLMRQEAENSVRTENGALAYATTLDSCLDLFATIGALRGADEKRIQRLFEKAYAQDALLTMKILFYARDIRGGLGERKVFRTLIRYIAKAHPKALLPNLEWIGFYGRYDDLYCLIGTPLEEAMWSVMKRQFEEDRENMEAGRTISLLAKWIKTADASSKRTRYLGILTAKKMGYPVYEFKRIVRRMRKYLQIVEPMMVQGRWDDITYSQVPSRAMFIYHNAFERHDEKRFAKYTQNVVEGVEKIHADTLFPYDIVEKVLYQGADKDILEAQWNSLPNYVEEGTNAIVVADVSGSMTGRPMASSIGLAIYFAERNKGAYHNLFMTFSENSNIVELKGNTLSEKIRNLSRAEWGWNTDLRKAFERILSIAVSNNVSANDLPKSIIVISDMEIDGCTSSDWRFYDEMKDRYARYGYEIPNVVFWNVNSRQNVFHADSKRKGVQLCSGNSVAVFNQLVGAVGKTPVEMMLETVNGERYERVRIGQR